MCVDSLHNPQLSLFGSYSVSEQFASTWRAPGAQTKCWCPWSCREGTAEPLDPAPCQGHRQNRISGWEEQTWEDLQRVWTLQDQSPEAVSCLASCLLLWLIHPPFFQRVPWVRRRFSLQIYSQRRITRSFSWVTFILQLSSYPKCWRKHSQSSPDFGTDCELRCPGMHSVSDAFYSDV